MEDKITQTKSKIDKKRKMECIIVGGIAGFLNGIFGGGGGMIVVPMLTYILKREQKKAHATAILIILPMSILSGLLYVTKQKMQIDITISVILGVTIGGVVGAFLLNKLSSKWVKIIFSLSMAVAGIKMLLF